jgi:hypothetical protein
MSRGYQKIKMMLPVIKEMMKEGMSHREIEAKLGLTGDRPIHNLLKRERRQLQQRIPKQRGRKAAITLDEYKYENKRLKMENELLRDFLHHAGRK